jgi:hypothetical protein
MYIDDSLYSMIWIEVVYANKGVCSIFFFSSENN